MSERLDKHNILYRPQIDYDKKYDTVGYINNEDDIESEITKPSSQLEDLKDKIENINSLKPLLPDELNELIEKPLDSIGPVIGDIKDDPERIPSIEEIITVDPVIDKEEVEDIIPEGPFRRDDEPIKVEVSVFDKVEIIKKEYEYDLVSIVDDYLNKLNGSINKFMETVLSLMKDFDIKLYPKVISKYNGNAKDISTNLKHLSDLIIRSQISRNMKTRLYNKMFNVDKTITHIRMCKVGVQQRIRYYESSYEVKDSIDNVVSNRMLENSRMIYDKKYRENFINLYKYLNSSVMLLDECFNMYINEAQAKIILMKKEGNDLW